MKKAEMPKCSNCMFYQIDNNNLSQGVCRRRSPELVAIPTGPGKALFRGQHPPVKGKSWCGEHAWKTVPEDN